MIDFRGEYPVLAVDLGGSKIVSALILPSGEISDREYILTLADEGPDAVINRMMASIDNLLARADLSPASLPTVCLAVAGIIDFAKGVVTTSPNLPDWRNVPLKRMVQEETGLETILLNDASAAALGEHCFGAGRGVDDLIYVTVSTGIGGGIIIGGKLYTGRSGSAGELGHMTIDVNGPYCNCGNAGCLEVLASGKAVAREARMAIDRGKKSLILEMAEGETQNITAKTVSAAAQKGDELALAIISHAATYLGVGMVNLVNAFNPGMIIVGGGMAKMGDMLLETARKVVNDRAFKLPVREVNIVPSLLEDNAALLGGAAFTWGLTEPL